MRKLYCGGRFDFDYLDADYLEKAGRDYRAVLLGSREAFLQYSEGVLIRENLMYIGPFYFESDGMLDTDIVRRETGMIHQCTDAIFLLDGADCPGTICELTLATTLGKRVHIFFLQKSDGEETESTLHTPCWYPILHSRMANRHTEIHPCGSIADAVRKIQAAVQSWDC